MTGVKKRTLRQAKLDMDVRVQGLRTVVASGVEAEKRLPALREELQATQRYLRTNSVYESARYEDGEKTPEDLESEIDALETNVVEANVAREELKRAAQFYHAYHIVAFMPKMRELKKRLTAAEYWVEQWKERINNLVLDSDMDIDERLAEKDYLEIEYSKAQDRVQQIQLQIKEIKNIKYM